MTYKKISIVIIDCGIDISISDLNCYVVKSTGFRVSSDGFISEYQEIKPTGTHGTFISLIIRDICRNVEFVSFNILNERMSTDSRVMIYAMNEALKLEPDIIHMSIGTTNWKYKSYIKKIIHFANERNIQIIAAANNWGLWTYPANLKDVIAVKTTGNAKSKYDYYKKGKYFYAPSSILDIDGKDELSGFNRMKGTSIAAAYITGHIANIKTNR